MLVLILIWPAQVATPVASGAVSWVPSTSYNASNGTLLLGTASTGYNWDWYNMFPNVREALVKKSAGLAGLTAASSFGDGGEGIAAATYAQRMGLQLSAYQNGTAVENATVPIFRIDSFKWVADVSTLPPGILKAVKDVGSGLLNITSGASPLSQTIGGTSALLKDSPWRRPGSKSLPTPQTFTGTKYAAIYVSRNPNQGQGAKYDCRTGASDFDPLPADVQLINIPYNNNHSDCLAVAELQVSAGITRCRQADLGPSPSSTCVIASGILVSGDETVSPDALVSEVFAMMPEVQAMGAALSLYEPDRLSGNLEVFLRNSLVQGYQGTWSALAESFTDGTRRLQTRTWEPVTLLDANVSARRMYVWMGLSLLLVASGLLLMTIQAACKGGTVDDPVIAAIMLDSTEGLKADHVRVDKTTDFWRGGVDVKTKLLLKLGGSETSADMGEKVHPRLVPQNLA